MIYSSNILRSGGAARGRREGEVAVPGTFSKDVGLLMTIADLSVILAKVNVDETDVVRLAYERRLGEPVTRSMHSRTRRSSLAG